MHNLICKIPFDWFVCPITKKPLVKNINEAVGLKGKYHYNINKRFWSFMPENLEEINKPEWFTWQKLQENGIVSYENDPIHNLGVGKRKDFIEFVEFCDFKGNILDIGCGPQKIPTHIKYNSNTSVFFVGIDPLIGEQPRDFSFVQGLGEYLPFKNELFDQVLYVTSLDHFIEPLVTLQEAKRVLKEDGNICIWIGEKSQNTPKSKESPEWYRKLIIPDGAEDLFHFKRLNKNILEGYFSDLKLKIKERKEIIVNKLQKNLFYKIVK